MGGSVCGMGGAAEVHREGITDETNNKKHGHTEVQWYSGTAVREKQQVTRRRQATVGRKRIPVLDEVRREEERQRNERGMSAERSTKRDKGNTNPSRPLNSWGGGKSR